MSMHGDIRNRLRTMPFVWIYTATITGGYLACLLWWSPSTTALGLSTQSFSVGQVYRLMSYAWLHAGGAHWFWNAVWLLVVGGLLESRIGSLRAVCVAAAEILGYGAAFLITNWGEASGTLIGSQAAVFGFAGAYGVTAWRQLARLPSWEKVLGAFLLTCCLLSVFSVIVPALVSLLLGGVVAALPTRSGAPQSMDTRALTKPCT